jgi:hypothetical protein
MDCDNYNNETCKKGIIGPLIETGKDELCFIFFGCWGTYCYEEPFELTKIKYDKEKDKIKFSKNETKYVGKSAVKIMKQYSEKKEIQAVIIGGDNIYQSPYFDVNKLKDSDTLKEIEKIEDKKKKKNAFEAYKNSTLNDYINDMDRQLKDGFENCVKNIKTDTFLVGIGNHDIITCNILNKQLNHPGWTMPALYYTYSYMLKDNSVINYIFIDTNIYSEDPFCNPKDKDLQKEAIATQYKWLYDVLNKNRNSYNIIVGHQPFSSNPHKPKETAYEINPELRKHLTDNNELIDLYLCADEHNQQYIFDSGINQVISGTGGAALDTEIYLATDPEIQTRFTSIGPGFVGIDINSVKIKLILTTKPNPEYSETIACYEILRKRF